MLGLQVGPRAWHPAARAGVVTALLALLAPASAARGARPPGDQFEALRWEGDRHGTLGPTGRRVFALRLEPSLGCRGEFAYGDASVLLRDPIRLELRRDGALLDLAHARTTWWPSRLESTWEDSELRLEEVKLVSEADAIVDELLLTNVGAEHLELTLEFLGGATPGLERSQSRQVTVALPWAPAEGTVLLDGVRYALPAPDASGAAQPRTPEGASIALPDERPAIVTLHALLAREHDGGDGTAPVALTLRLDDGSAEPLSWPGVEALTTAALEGIAGTPVGATLADPARERVEWRALRVPGLEAPVLQLSYTPPPGRSAVRLELGAGSAGARLLAATVEVPPASGRLPVLVGEADLAGQPVHAVLVATDAIPGRRPDGERCLTAHVSLAPGASKRLRVLVATGTRSLPVLLQAMDLAADDELVDRDIATRAAWWNDHVPGFRCSDPWLERAWLHRWDLVRRDLLWLDLPDFSLPVAYEGTCCREHAQVSPRAGAFALRELRWLHDVPAAQGLVRALLKLQAPDGLLVPVSPHARGAPQAHALAADAIGVHAVTGSRQYLMEVLALLERDLDATLERVADGAGGLPASADRHYLGLTGRPLLRLVEPGERIAPVDLSCAIFASARALAEGHRALDQGSRAERLEGLAAELRTQVLARSWSERDAWFLSLRGDGEPLRCREAAGILPLATGLAPPRAPYLAALDTLASPGGFWALHPVRSVARDDGATFPAAARADPSAWDGPVRPEAQTWTLDALARAARAGSEVDRRRLEQLLDAWTRLHFEGGDLTRAITREAYDPATGAGTGCVDVLRSAYLDVLVQVVAGLVPRADGVLELHPLVRRLDHFRFAGLPYHGRLVDVTWDRPDGEARYEAEGCPEGFTVDVDGARVHRSLTLEPWSER